MHMASMDGECEAHQVIKFPICQLDLCHDHLETQDGKINPTSWNTECNNGSRTQINYDLI